MYETQKSKTDIQDYYGKVLKSSKDLKTSACCTNEAIPEKHKKVLAKIHDEVLSKFYGCGSPLPDALEGKTVLDLGCGTGRDVYLLSALVGSSGKVIGVDMTNEQLDTAKAHINYHIEVFGYKEPNVDFRFGYIEDLKTVGLEDNSVDVVVSNCVINLSPDKETVFSEIFRVLKPGGELYFSDVFADRRIPAHLFDDPVLLGECLSGAMYTEDFRRMLIRLGCPDYRVVSQSPIEIEDQQIAEKIGMINFTSKTIRAFKLDSLEDQCEDFGQTATYLGNIAGLPHRFSLDDHHLFQTGKPELICGNTAAMLKETRFKEHFKITGDRSLHFGLFDCSDSKNRDENISGNCC